MSVLTPLHGKRNLSVWKCLLDIKNSRPILRHQKMSEPSLKTFPNRRKTSLVVCVVRLLQKNLEFSELISAHLHCFRADQLWFSLNHVCSGLKNSALNIAVCEKISSESALFTTDFLVLKDRIFSAGMLWIGSDINTCNWEDQIVVMLSEVMKMHEVVIEMLFLVLTKM